MAKEKRSVADLDAELAALEEELAALEGRKPAPRKAPPPAPKPAPEAEAPGPAPEPATPAPEKKRFGFGKKKADEAAPQYETTAPAEPMPEKKRFGFGRKKDEPPPAESAEGRSRLGLPALGRKGRAEPVEETPREPERHYVDRAPERVMEAPIPAPAPRARAPPPIPVTDPSVWRQEESAWVRIVPDRPATRVRRILDEEDRVVREEPVSESDLRDEGRDEPDAPQEKSKPSIGRLFRRKG